MLVTLDIVGGDDEFLTVLELDLVLALLVLLEPATTNLGALEINQDCYVAPCLLAGLAHVVVDLEMVLGGAVRTVQPGDIHTRLNELGEVLQGLRSRSDSVHNLGFAHLMPAYS